MRALKHFTVLAVLVTLVAGCSSANRNLGDRRTDSSITGAVKEQLVRDRAANLSRVDVDTRGGTVYLTGEVPTIEDKNRAGQMARNTSGVSNVVNDLRVTSMSMAPTATDRHGVYAAADNPSCVIVPRIHGVELRVFDDFITPAQPRTAGLSRPGTGDPALSAAVKDRLIAENVADARNIYVEADREHVFLDGTVTTLEEKRRAGEIAQQVTGASQIDNNLRLQSEPYSDARDTREFRDRGDMRTDHGDVRTIDQRELRGDPIWTGKLARGHRYDIRSPHGLIRYDYRFLPNERFHGDVGAWCNNGHTVVVP
jgi:hyperosmotically inducible periplasmic protein